MKNAEDPTKPASGDTIESLNRNVIEIENMLARGISTTEKDDRTARIEIIRKVVKRDSDDDENTLTVAQRRLLELERETAINKYGTSQPNS